MSEERDRNAVAVDYETFFSTKAGYSLTNMSPQNYCADKRSDAYLVAICGEHIFDGPTDDPCAFVTQDVKDTVFRTLDDGRQLYIGRPEYFRHWNQLKDRILLAHNVGFDSVVTDELVNRNILPGFLKDTEWKCTADLSAYLMAPRNLKGAMKVLFGREISKEIRAGMDGRHDYDLSQDEYRALVEYGGSDAVECHDIWLKYCSEWTDIERRISDQKRNAIKRGVHVDAEYCRRALQELRSYYAKVVCDIPWASQINPKTKDFYAVGSIPALRQAVIDLGAEPPKSFKKDDPGFLDWLKSHDDIPFIRARQKAVAISMHSARLEGILNSLDENGDSHPQFLYYGAHTGRDSGKSSVGGGNVNMLNMPRKPVLAGDENVFGGKGVDIRGMYVARPGYKFVTFDYSQIEARFSLWLVDDQHMMSAIREEGNLYGAAAVAMGWCKPHSDIKHKDPDLYRLAKCATLGLGYGMGAAKFVDSCKSQGLDLPSVPVGEWPELDRRLLFIIRNVARVKGDPYSDRNREKVGQLIRALQVVDDWRRANSKIVSQWKYYESVFKQRVAAGKKTVAFRLPSGRIKRYYDPCLCKEETVEVDENGREHPSFRIAMKATTVRGNPATSFTGGNIMENIVQATCRDIMAFSAVEICDRHPTWHHVFSVYDEIVTEVPEDEVELALREIPDIMCHGEYIRDWTEGLLLEVEGDAAERYHK